MGGIANGWMDNAKCPDKWNLQYQMTTGVDQAQRSYNNRTVRVGRGDNSVNDSRSLLVPPCKIAQLPSRSINSLWTEKKTYHFSPSYRQPLYIYREIDRILQGKIVVLMVATFVVTAAFANPVAPAAADEEADNAHDLETAESLLEIIEKKIAKLYKKCLKLGGCQPYYSYSNYGHSSDYGYGSNYGSGYGSSHGGYGSSHGGGYGGGAGYGYY
uniref:Uncharacterized protein n=1 Tax=Daphnia galeata TaxID=27404 RepID=A0A8J2S1V3_9CRUS|nr:unnamed protein product [Daphnia galeata]